MGGISMRKRCFDVSIENLFLERMEQLNPRDISSEYRVYSAKYEQLYNELRDALPEKMHRKLMDLSDTECAMGSIAISLFYEQAFLEGAKLMRYLLHNEKPVISGTIMQALEEEKSIDDQLKNVV